MVFHGQPGLLVIDSRTNKPVFRFDAEGKYETFDSKLIAKLMPRFEHEESAFNNGEGLLCKFCGQWIKGNHGNRLAHIRKYHRAEQVKAKKNYDL